MFSMSTALSTRNILVNKIRFCLLPKRVKKLKANEQETIMW